MYLSFFTKIFCERGHDWIGEGMRGEVWKRIKFYGIYTQKILFEDVSEHSNMAAISWGLLNADAAKYVCGL